MIKRKFSVCMGLALSALLVFAGCGGGGGNQAGGGATTSPDGATGSTTIMVEGSTSVDPLMQILRDRYTAQNGNVQIEITANGSGNGISAAMKGTTDIGMSSRNLAEDETGLTATVIAHDGIAVVVNSENPVTSLTQEQLTQIYKGEIRNWSEVGGPDAEINLVIRDAESGTRSAFEEILSLADDSGTLVDEANAVVMDATSGVIQTVRGNANAIGYISFGSMSDDVKAIAVDGVACSAETVKDGTYAISRPFILVTQEGEVKPEVQAFIDYILSDEGQQIVTDEKYVSVN